MVDATLTAAASGGWPPVSKRNAERVYCVDDFPLNVSFWMPAPVPAI